MTMRSPSLARGGIALLLISLLAVGCGGTVPAATDSPAAQTSQAPGTSVAPPSDAPGVADSGQPGSEIEVCKIVTVADVEALYPGTTVKASSTMAGPMGCSYSFQPEDEGFSIEVVTGDQALTFWTGNIPSQGDYSIPLDGIGSQAMREPGNANLVSISGSTFCEIESGMVAELYTGLATPDANDTIPDASAIAIAQKLGTLCNKIFAAQ